MHFLIPYSLFLISYFLLRTPLDLFHKIAFRRIYLQLINTCSEIADIEVILYGDVGQRFIQHQRLIHTLYPDPGFALDIFCRDRDRPA